MATGSAVSREFGATPGVQYFLPTQDSPPASNTTSNSVTGQIISLLLAANDRHIRLVTVAQPGLLALLKQWEFEFGDKFDPNFEKDLKELEEAPIQLGSSNFE